MNLRNEAKGRECAVRLPGVCNHNPETVVLAHIRMPGITGFGQKAPDLLGAWCCSACHDVADKRARTELDAAFVRIEFLEGIMRTQYQLIKEGKVKW